MSGFASQTLEKKLSDLNNSQQSIQTLSLWLIHHRKHHKAIVQTWFSELKKAKASRRLTFMYLANDVIQNSRKKGPEFSKEFGVVLKLAFESVAKDSDDKTLSSLDRILTIWEQRTIYDANDIISFKSALTLRKNQQINDKDVNNTNKTNDTKTSLDNKVDTKMTQKRSEERKKENHKSSKNNKHEKGEKESKKRSNDSKDTNAAKKKATNDSKNSVSFKKKVVTFETLMKSSTKNDEPVLSSGPIVDPEALIKALQQLENSASADAGVRQKIASLPTEVFDATLLEKIRDKLSAERLTKLVDEARVLLADYNARLAQELEDRKQISLLLKNYTQNQRYALSLTEQKLNEFKDKLRKVIHVRNELKSHLQNLPDLSRLPSVTGLAPLPSACDLFNVARDNMMGVNTAGSVSSSVSPNESNASPIDFGTPGSNTS
ncbi:regulation of nuclear pre-mRNA domain-containing protein 1B-like [Oppia nitens]|uniref:regulation of nuclear pre-mRNA domain-containing protein 1B-like n=1 Tax=Oppia nitens TaxID=1686743 RepID=UPI0023DA2574|nr:regulation of nuclear pre-mRNA domain-containing protein 1B-like [Oppia nitens]